ncbi:MAG: hypothetical protein JWR84_1869 [Caulobacter sp.]|nr:hypothetical protein [Caulobacter sp.]
MADAGSAATAAELRKERVHTTMLIEVLALLIFMAMAFAFLSRDESRHDRAMERIRELTEELDAAKRTIAAQRIEIRKLQLSNEQLAESLRRLAKMNNDTLRANDKLVVLPQSQLDELTGNIANKDAMLDERQKSNAALRAKLAQSQGGGTDLPNCTVTSGFLLSIELMGDGGFVVRQAWAPGADPVARSLPGALELTSGQMSVARFEAGAARLRDWGRAQSVPCGFRARVTNRHSNLDLYKRQNRIVERYFYTARY